MSRRAPPHGAFACIPATGRLRRPTRRLGHYRRSEAHRCAARPQPLARRRTPREAASRVSACGTACGAGGRSDVGEHAGGVPGWERSYRGRGALKLDAAPADSLAPGEMASVPFDEGFGVRRDVQVLIEAGVRLADLSVSELDE